MSKGTKQIRLGRVMNMLEEFERRLETYQRYAEGFQAEHPKVALEFKHRAWEMESTVKWIKTEFEL